MSAKALPTPQISETGRGVEEGERILASDHGKTARLVEIGAGLRKKLAIGKADRDRDADLAFDLRLKAGERLGRARLVQPCGAGEIEKRFIERQRLDKRGQLQHRRADLAANGGVFRHVGPDDRCVWAKLERLEHRLRRVDAEGARNVAGGGDHPALAPANNQRLVTQGRIIALLDRRIERVAVDMRDRKGVKLLVLYEARAAAHGATPGLIARVVGGGEALTAERDHLAGHSHAAPRTPEESP